MFDVCSFCCWTFYIYLCLCTHYYKTVWLPFELALDVMLLHLTGLSIEASLYSAKRPICPFYWHYKAGKVKRLAEGSVSKMSEANQVKMERNFLLDSNVLINLVCMNRLNWTKNKFLGKGIKSVDIPYFYLQMVFCIKFISIMPMGFSLKDTSPSLRGLRVHDPGLIPVHILPPTNLCFVDLLNL